MTAKKLVANFKANGNLLFFQDYISQLPPNIPDHLNIVLLPPAPYLASCTLPTAFALGAQGCSVHNSGAATGETTLDMLKDCRARYVLLAHSEHYQLGAETDTAVQHKAQRAAQAGITPIICVGEPHDIRTQGHTAEHLTQQLGARIPSDLDTFWVAYEPLWAIGATAPPQTHDIVSAHQTIRAYLTKQGKARMPILYGGSVSTHNAPMLLKEPEIDGVLVGRACWTPDFFPTLLSALSH